MPYGPLSKFITNEIDFILDVKHLADLFVVNNLEDRNNLIECAKLYDITPPPIVTYSFEYPFIEEAKQLPQYQDLPIPVANVLLDYGLNYIVSIDYLLLLEG